MIRILYLTFVYLLFNVLFKTTQSAGYHCIAYEQNVDYKGNDVTFTYDVRTPQDCERICILLKSVCKGFTFWKGAKTVCFIKNFFGQPVRLTAPGRKQYLN
jgi:hypothetical protein